MSTYLADKEPVPKSLFTVPFRSPTEGLQYLIGFFFIPKAPVYFYIGVPLLEGVQPYENRYSVFHHKLLLAQSSSSLSWFEAPRFLLLRAFFPSFPFFDLSGALFGS